MRTQYGQHWGCRLGSDEARDRGEEAITISPSFSKSALHKASNRRTFCRSSLLLNWPHLPPPGAAHVQRRNEWPSSAFCVVRRTIASSSSMHQRQTMNANSSPRPRRVHAVGVMAHLNRHQAFSQSKTGTGYWRVEGWVVLTFLALLRWLAGKALTDRTVGQSVKRCRGKVNPDFFLKFVEGLHRRQGIQSKSFEVRIVLKFCNVECCTGTLLSGRNWMFWF